MERRKAMNQNKDKPVAIALFTANYGPFVFLNPPEIRIGNYSNTIDCQ